MTRAVLIALLAALAALAFGLAACQDPYQTDQPTRRPAATGTPQTARDLPEPGPTEPAPTATPHGPASSARATAVAFARTWSTWDWRTAADQQRTLARLAVGSLAAELRASANAAGHDASLTRDRPGSRGHVIAIELHDSARAIAAIVVTREQTYTNGHADLGGQHHRVYRTTLVPVADGWRVSAWTPLP